MELLEKLFTSTPLQLALVAIVLLVLGTGPVGRKLSALLEHRHASEKVERIDGHSILRLVETSQVGLPRNWEKAIDEKIDHAKRNIKGSIDGLTEITRDCRGSLKEVDGKVDDIQRRLARIEGSLDHPRARG